MTENWECIQNPAAFVSHDIYCKQGMSHATKEMFILIPRSLFFFENKDNAAVQFPMLKMWLPAVLCSKTGGQLKIVFD